MKRTHAAQSDNTDNSQETKKQSQLLSLGVPPLLAAVPQLLPKTHQVGGQREGRVQDSGQQGGVPAVGAPQEQAGHELRDHGPGAEVLLPEGHPRQGGRPEARLPVRE